MKRTYAVPQRPILRSWFVHILLLVAIIAALLRIIQDKRLMV
jgi:hypothetical protein